MRYVLTDVAGENYRLADGKWTSQIDEAERFEYDAAVVRQEELMAEDCHTRVVETHGRSRKLSESMIMRITKALGYLEEQWEGKTIGIGYECDVEAGRINLILEPDGEPELCLQVNVDISNVLVGQGDGN
jgi:hypothetical protein